MACWPRLTVPTRALACARRVSRPQSPALNWLARRRAKPQAIEGSLLTLPERRPNNRKRRARHRRTPSPRSSVKTVGALGCRLPAREGGEAASPNSKTVGADSRGRSRRSFRHRTGRNSCGRCTIRRPTIAERPATAPIPHTGMGFQICPEIVVKHPLRSLAQSNAADRFRPPAPVAMSLFALRARLEHPASSAAAAARRPAMRAWSSTRTSGYRLFVVAANKVARKGKICERRPSRGRSVDVAGRWNWGGGSRAYEPGFPFSRHRQIGVERLPTVGVAPSRVEGNTVGCLSRHSWYGC
jgi:hypothetical protein